MKFYQSLARTFPTILLGLYIPLLIALSGTASRAHAVDATNWDGFAFWMETSRTNFVAGSRIPVQVIVSNTLDHHNNALSWNDGNRCNSGLGEFLVTNLDSGRQVECPLSRHGRGRSTSGQISPFEPHRIRTFYGELTGGYGLASAGLYAVQAIVEPRCFVSGDRTNDLLTPPVVIRLLPNREGAPPPGARWTACCSGWICLAPISWLRMAFRSRSLFQIPSTVSIG